jgi:hypothetical protein
MCHRERRTTKFELREMSVYRGWTATRFDPSCKCDKRATWHIGSVLEVYPSRRSTMNAVNPEVERGVAIYNRRVLRLYDLVVVHLSNSLVWRCSRHRQLAQYEANLGARHLDVGPGTGWYLAHAKASFTTPTTTSMGFGGSWTGTSPSRRSRSSAPSHFSAPSGRGNRHAYRVPVTSDSPQGTPYALSSRR